MLEPLAALADALPRLKRRPTDFQKIKFNCSVFSHLLDTPEHEKDLASVVLQSQVIYHATLYTATLQRFACSPPNKGIRSALHHEALVLRSVQKAISETHIPSEEVIFATALLGISKVSRPTTWMHRSNFRLLIAFSPSLFSTRVRAEQCILKYHFPRALQHRDQSQLSFR